MSAYILLNVDVKVTQQGRIFFFIDDFSDNTTKNKSRNTDLELRMYLLIIRKLNLQALLN